MSSNISKIAPTPPINKKGTLIIFNINPIKLLIHLCFGLNDNVIPTLIHPTMNSYSPLRVLSYVILMNGNICNWPNMVCLLMFIRFNYVYNSF
jgi:hypothetical protein